MRQFPLDATLDHALPKGKVQNRHIDQLAKDLARFHTSLPASPESTSLGDSEVVGKTVMDVLDHFSQETPIPQTTVIFFDHSTQWLQQEHAHCDQAFANRKSQGFIRECHGDLHLGNVVLLDDIATPFDGIEFSERLRWIDVMSDISFFVVDCMAHGRRDFAARFLNAYLEQTGDYEGMAIIRFYEVYRALVRAKIARIRLNQNPQVDEHIGLSCRPMSSIHHPSSKVGSPRPSEPHYHAWALRFGKVYAFPKPLGIDGDDSPAIRYRTQATVWPVPRPAAVAREVKTELYGSDTTDALVPPFTEHGTKTPFIRLYRDCGCNISQTPLSRSLSPTRGGGSRSVPHSGCSIIPRDNAGADYHSGRTTVRCIGS